MGLVAISVLIASIVYLLIRPPSWLPLPKTLLRRLSLPAVDTTADRSGNLQDDAASDLAPSPLMASTSTPNPPGNYRERPTNGASSPLPPPSTPSPPPPSSSSASASTPSASTGIALDPASPPSPKDSEASLTPKAEPTRPEHLIPTLLPPLSTRSDASSASTSAGLMPPPPRPSVPRVAVPSLRPLPGLAPPPSQAARNPKPSRQVTLEPGHSPLDWARISGPNADLRGLDPSTPPLRISPSMLRAQTGRKGKDAWMALGGRVYNVTPYAKFHPGGVPELMRGAGRDATRLFAETHPWVNYETMLAACLVGLLVDEHEADGRHESELDRMD